MNQNEGFSKSTAALAKTFMYRAFDSEEYARSLSAQSDGDKDLIEKRAKISQVWENDSMIRSPPPLGKRTQLYIRRSPVSIATELKIVLISITIIIRYFETWRKWWRQVTLCRNKSFHSPPLPKGFWTSNRSLLSFVIGRTTTISLIAISFSK